MKKGQGISLNTLIIAALCLLVLIVLALIFTGRIRVFGTESRKCINLGGSCEEKCDPNEATVRDSDCAYECCIDIYSSDTDNEY